MTPTDPGPRPIRGAYRGPGAQQRYNTDLDAWRRRKTASPRRGGFLARLLGAKPPATTGSYGGSGRTWWWRCEICGASQTDLGTADDALHIGALHTQRVHGIPMICRVYGVTQ